MAAATGGRISYCFLDQDRAEVASDGKYGIMAVPKSCFMVVQGSWLEWRMTIVRQNNLDS